MTIRGSRTAGAGIAAISLGVDVVLAASAVLLALLRQPAFLYLGSLLLTVQAFGVASMLQPVSLSLEASDVVYRSLKGARRIALSEIARCRQVVASWVFSNASGAQLLAVPAVRFGDTDIAAFCALAGIDFTGRTLGSVDRLRSDVSATKSARNWALGLAIPLLVVVGLVIYGEFNAQDTLRRYQAAPLCQQASPTTTSCRLQTQARVTRVKRYATVGDLHLTLVPGGGDYVARMDLPTPAIGDTPEVEVWSGNITLINGRETSYNPALSPNLHLERASAVPGLFVLLCLVTAVVAHYRLGVARARLRAATAGNTAVQTLEVNPPLHGVELPPCGVQHHPKELLFVRDDPKGVVSAMAVLSAIAAVVFGGLVLGALYISLPVFGGIALLGLAFYAVQMVAAFRVLRFAGLFADDLHVGSITTDWIGRRERKVFDRKSVLEVTVEQGKITVVGVDGSTLFWTSLVSPADMDRYAGFLKVRVEHGAAPEQRDSIAVPAVQTPMGILPVGVRRAAGILQTFGGLFIGLAVINLVAIPRAPADRRSLVLLLLGALAVYGATLYVLGMMIARGRKHSRGLALFVGGAATAAFIVVWYVVLGNAMVAGAVGVLVVLFYALAMFWLRPAKQSGR